MFNGIVEEAGRVEHARMQDDIMDLRIACRFSGELGVDDSISVNGVCQTVVDRDEQTFRVQVIRETLRKTALSKLQAGAKVNLERSMVLSQRIDGHIVQGHVDATGEITRIDDHDGEHLVTVRYPEAYRDLVVERGSISLDGISLTVARMEQDTFTVALIPYTLQHTNMDEHRKGNPVNLEFDVLGKYVVRYMENRGGST